MQEQKNSDETDLLGSQNCIPSLSSYPSSSSIRTLPDDYYTDQNEDSAHYNSEDFKILNLNLSPPFECVVFTELEEVYQMNTDIDCKFTIIRNIEMKRGDHVSLYPIEWNEQENNELCIASIPCFECETDNFSYPTRQLKFLKKDLSKIECNVMYQFCYINSEGNVLGKSTPFTFKQPNADDFVEMNDQNQASQDDDGFVVVRSKQALFNDRLKQLTFNNGILEYNKKKLQKEIKLKEKELSKLKNDLLVNGITVQELDNKLKKATDKIKELEFEKALLSSQLDDSNSSCLQNSEAIELKNKEIFELKKILEISHSQQIALQNKLGKALSDINSEKLIKNKLFEEITELRSSTEKNNTETVDKLKKMEKVKNDALEAVNALKQELEKLQIMAKKEKAETELMKEDFTKKLNEAKTESYELGARLMSAKKEYELLYKKKISLESKFKFLKSKFNESKEKSISPGENATSSSQRMVEQLSYSADESEKLVENLDKGIVLPCIECNENIYCTGENSIPMLTHLELQHKKFICPFCSQIFDLTFDDAHKYFELHVENHFDIPKELLNN